MRTRLFDDNMADDVIGGSAGKEHIILKPIFAQETVLRAIFDAEAGHPLPVANRSWVGPTEIGKIPRLDEGQRTMPGRLDDARGHSLRTAIGVHAENEGDLDGSARHIDHVPCNLLLPIEDLPDSA